MALNKYVGRRYIPKIEGPWTNTREYESLVIVIHEGNSYTSKKNVPSGIDIKNEEFWIKSGDYNLQIVNIENEIQQFKKSIDDSITNCINKVESYDNAINEVLEKEFFVVSTELPPIENRNDNVAYFRINDKGLTYENSNGDKFLFASDTSIINHNGKKLNETLEDIETTIKENDITKNIYHEFLNYIPPTTTGYYLQSICYVEKDNCFVCGYRELIDNNTNALIVKYNATSFEEVSSKIITGYHINDMTYNNKTDELLITPMSDIRSTSYIYVLDYKTLEKKSELVPDGFVTGDYIATIGYDKENDYIVSYTTKGLYIWDSAFNLINSFTINRGDLILQSIEVHEEKIYILFYSSLWIYNYDGVCLRKLNLSSAGEHEGITAFKGKMCVGNVNYYNFNESAKLYTFNVEGDTQNYDWHIFSSLNDIGIKEGSETIDDIANNLPQCSRLMVQMYSKNPSTIYPNRSGLLEVIKYDISKVFFNYYSANNVKNVIYHGLYNTNLEPKWSGWTTSEINDVLFSGEQYNGSITLNNSISNYRELLIHLSGNGYTFKLVPTSYNTFAIREFNLGNNVTNTDIQFLEMNIVKDNDVNLNIASNYILSRDNEGVFSKVDVTSENSTIGLKIIKIEGKR